MRVRIVRASVLATWFGVGIAAIGTAIVIVVNVAIVVVIAITAAVDCTIVTRVISTATARNRGRVEAVVETGLLWSRIREFLLMLLRLHVTSGLLWLRLRLLLLLRWWWRHLLLINSQLQLVTLVPQLRRSQSTCSQIRRDLLGDLREFPGE